MTRKRKKPTPPSPTARQAGGAAPVAPAPSVGFVDSLAYHLKTQPPLGVFLAALILMMGLIILSQMVAQQDLYFIYKIRLGFDYGAFYNAAKITLAGGNPYNPPLPHAFTTPPLSAIANIPLTVLPFATAAVVVSLLTYAAVVASMFLVYRVFNAPPSIPKPNEPA